MGNLISVICCIKNDDIINNRNYPTSFYQNSSSDEKFNSILQKSEKSLNEKLPVSIINTTNESNTEISKDLDLTSKYVIVRKEGSPLADYDAISKLGEGTFGKVFKVKHKHNKILYAMKQISKYNLSNIGQNKIMKEIEILKKLNYIYIIKLYEYYITDDFIFLINELSNEGDLQSKMMKIKIFPEFIVKIIMLQIFKALRFLNEKSIIHGDLKLENILVVTYNNEKEKKKNKKEDGFIEAIKHDMKIINEKLNSVPKTETFQRFDKKFISNINKNIKESQNGGIQTYGTINFKFRNNFHLAEKEGDKKKENNKIKKIKDLNKKQNNIYTDFEELHIYNYGIKLIDFGCSKIFTRTKKSFNDIIGTLVYCAPEVLSNNYNKSCDIWSCGVIMYYLLSGKFPFEGENEEETKKKILESKFDFDIEHFNNISEEAKDLISKCLKYEPRKRITVVDALNHKFFDDINQSETFTEEEKKKLKSLKELSKKSKFYQLVLTYLSYRFSDNKLLNELNQLYNKLDRNTDYKITKAELYKAYKETKIPITAKDIDDIINSMDFNSNGDIDYEEFIRMCIPKEKLFTEENLKSAFLMFDKEKKGFITPQKIIDFIESTKHISENLKAQITNEIIDLADEIIDYEDFRDFMMN